jgi:hypothetical protein
MAHEGPKLVGGILQIVGVVPQLNVLVDLITKLLQ